MDFERRLSERLSFDMRECQGMFVLETPEDEFEIESVNDISSTGIGFELPSYLDPETPVRLSYEEAGIAVGVRGEVVWCDGDPDRPDAFRLGVRFADDTGEAGGRLLHAVRCYTVSREDASL